MRGFFIGQDAMTATSVVLTGAMAKRFQKRYSLHLDSKTPGEAFRALATIVPGFRDYLLRAHHRGIEFAVWRGKGPAEENISEAQLGEPAGDTIRIAPILKGSKAGVLQTIVGAVLIIAGAIVSGMSFGLAAPIGAAMISAGVAMVAGGVIQMLSPQPKVSKNADSADNQGSYVFSGPVNTTAQGNPVPVLYGRMIVGSAVISAGMEADDYSPATNGVGSGVPGGSRLKTPYDTLPA
jgi:predicted phage tail protein